MDLSEILNLVLGGGLATALTALITIRPTVRKANAAAETVRIDNVDKATHILIENIVEPLKKELNATRREMARLRKAIDGANDCEYRSDCPVLYELRDIQNPGSDEPVDPVRPNADSQRNASAGLLMAGIPESVMKLKIPVVDLLSLPPNASFHGKEGRAGAGVALRGDTLVVTATCDSLQRLVLWYESELTRIRSETKSEISNDVQTEEKRPPNPVRVFILGMVTGLLVGMLLTMKLKKR